MVLQKNYNNESVSQFWEFEMSDKALIIEATHKDESLIIGIQEKTNSFLEASIETYDDLHISKEDIDSIESACQSTIEALNKKGRKQKIDPTAINKLKDLGILLADKLLSPEIRKLLYEKNDIEYLIFKIDESLVSFPWEHICIDNKFLCQMYCIGRIVKSKQNSTFPDYRSLSNPLSVWILADPCNDLDSAREEGDKIETFMDSLNSDETILIKASQDHRTSKRKIKSCLKEKDFIHFAGHSDHNVKDYKQSGWKISEHEHFSPEDIDQMSGTPPMPVLVFSNSCQSARTDAWRKDDHSFGMANAFLRSGVRFYIGAFWEILDEPGNIFAQKFYNFLLKENMSIGAAVKKAREALISEYGNAFVGWAAYVLYGDPRFVCIKGKESLVEKPFDDSVALEKTIAAFPRSEKKQYESSSQQDERFDEIASDLFHPGPMEQTIIIDFRKIGLFALVISLGLVVASVNYLSFESRKYRAESIQKEKVNVKKDILNNQGAFEKNNHPDVSPKSSKVKPVTIAIEYDMAESIATNGIERKVASQLANQLQERYSDNRLVLVERLQLNAIVDETFLSNTRFVSEENRLDTDWKTAQYKLFFEVDESFIYAAIHMKLMDSQQTHSWEAKPVSINQWFSLSSQNIIQTLIPVLEEHVLKNAPLSGH